MAGAVVSTTDTIWVQVAVLPHSSVAVQVRVAAKVLPQAALVVVPVTTTMLVPQELTAVGASNVQATPHSTVLLATQLRPTLICDGPMVIEPEPPGEKLLGYVARRLA